MIQTIGDVISSALGLDAETLGAGQIALRAAIIYLFGMIIVRFGGDRRFIGKHAAFDVILSIILGSTLSRAINGAAPFFGTLGGAAVLVALHWLVAALACRFEPLDPMIKGHSRILIQDGQISRKALRDYHISQKDLESALRQGAKITDPARVKLAFQESNGSISILPREKEPQIVEVDVEEGVQTVRIQLNG